MFATPAFAQTAGAAASGGAEEMLAFMAPQEGSGA